MSARDALREYVHLLADMWTPASQTDKRVERLYTAVRTEVLAEEGLLPKADVVAWLTKKAREFRAIGTKQGQAQADAVAAMASKVEHGAVRPDNLRMLPPDFFEPGHSYTHRDGSTFRCVAVTAHPEGGERVALGWHTDTADWTFVAVRNINHWNYEYDGVEPPAEDGESR